MQLIEHYASLQGEGLHPGKLTYFVRFARCNLRCAWCDSEYTFGAGRKTSFSAVASALRRSGARFVCLTGGEPLLHREDCVRLIRAFPQLHFDLETGGSLDIAPVQYANTSVIMDWKLRSSGMSRKMKPGNLPLLRREQDLLKLVTDGSSAERKEIRGILRKTEKYGFPVSIQPLHGIDPAPLAEWTISLKNPRLQFNLQLHKLIWPRRTSGV
jgi:7-carboxy-7-deazaguanine synthase